MPAGVEDRFAAALRDRQLAVPEGITSWTGPRPERRFRVYRNNVSAGLVEALAARYPVVQRLVGEEFFRAMGAEYVRAHLPASPVLIGYGEDYPAFVEAFPPAAPVPYLADVARLESAYWRAYHAADAASIAPDALAAACLVLHPAVQIVASRWPIVSVWETNTRDAEVVPVELDRGEDALLSRPALEVFVRRLPEGAVRFLADLGRGAALGPAAEAAAAAEPRFDLAANLAGLIEARLVTEIRDGD